MKKNLFKFLKFIGIILLAFLILLGIALLIMQTDWFTEQIKKIIVKEANKNLLAELSIEKIEGDIWKDIKIINIDLQLDGQSIINLESVRLQFDLKRILQKEITVSAIELNLPALNLQQNSAGGWNFQKIFAVPAPSEKPEKKSAFLIKLEKISVNGGRLDLKFFEQNEFLPKKILIAEITCSATISDTIFWRIERAELAVFPQDFKLEFSSISSRNPDEIDIARIELETAENRILLNGSLISLQKRKAKVTLLADSFSLNELQRWLPSAKLSGNPEIKLTAQIEGDFAEMKLALNDAEQNLNLHLQLADLQNPFQARAEANWQNIDLHTWLPEQPSTDLNGKFALSTSGTNLENISADFDLKMSESVWAERKVQKVELSCRGNADKLMEDLRLESEWGNIELTGTLENLPAEIRYDLKGKFWQFDLNPFTNQISEPSELNLDFTLQGSGVSVETNKSSLNLNIKDSEIAGFSVDDFDLQASYDQGKYQIDKLIFDNQFAGLYLSGKGDIKGTHQLVYRVQIDSLPQNIIPQLTDFTLQAALTGSVKGDLHNLENKSTLRISDFGYQDFSFAALNSEFTLNLRDEIISAKTETTINDLNLPGYRIDSIGIKADYHPEISFAEIDLQQSDSLSLSTKLSCLPGEKQQILISQLAIRIADEIWQNADDSLRIEFAEQFYQVHHLNLQNREQIFSAEGFLNLQGENNFSLSLQNLDLKSLLSSIRRQMPVSGTMDLHVNILGNRRSPSFRSNLQIENGQFNSINFELLQGDFDLQEQQLNVAVQLNRTESDSLSVTGFLPLAIDLERNIVDLKRDEPFFFRLHSSPIQLDFLSSYYKPISQIRGELIVLVEAANTLAQPLVDSSVKLTGGKLKIPLWGINYKNINLHLETSQNNLHLKELSLETGVKKQKGNLKIAGNAFYDLIENQLETFDFSITSHNWAAVNSQELNLDLDIDLQMEGSGDEPRLNGFIKVNRARYYLPSSQQSSSAAKPLLLSATTQKEQDSELPAKQGGQSPLLLDNLRGNILVSFPRNTWIRSKEMNIELSGEVRALKNGPDLALFGTISIQKGTYQLYGKKFDFTSGRIILNGEKDLNPYIDVQARHILLGAGGDKNILLITISGNLKNPQIFFTYDGSPISEADGFSYLVFGKSLNELSYGEKKQIDQTSGDKIAIKLLADQLVSRVTSSIQSELELDVMEFKGSSNWSQASLIVGKYLTDNLFISYQNEFSFGRSRQIAPQQISLEYEFKRHFSLQAISGSEKTTGLDLVWKYRK